MARLIILLTYLDHDLTLPLVTRMIPLPRIADFWCRLCTSHAERQAFADDKVA
ncbi:hypothetical protein Ga0466249_001307 [Sporomusaceae bacterium BoRhaA]|nr:hypothetical protein [Pelorhabdus rhamnosifermentans]